VQPLRRGECFAVGAQSQGMPDARHQEWRNSVAPAPYFRVRMTACPNQHSPCAR
jgi:hypothetical protein